VLDDDPNSDDGDRTTDTSDALNPLAALSHEVHQPLTYLIASLDSLRHALADASSGRVVQLRCWIERATASAEHIGRLVNDAGPVYQVTRAQRLDLGAVVHQTLDIVVGEVRRRARLDRELLPNVCVFADETRLRQVILNLVMNALLALPEGQPARHHIVVRVESIGSRALVEVEDDGPCDPDEPLRRFAAPFFTTEQDGRAIGLGLAICKRIVHGCGGVLEFARGRHGGSVVRAVFPLSEEQAA